MRLFHLAIVFGVFLLAPLATFAGEASLALPDLEKSRFTIAGNDISGRNLLLSGAVMILGTLGISLYLRGQVAKLPAHKSMLDVADIIFVTCKTYLVQQAKFLLMLFALIAAAMTYYFMGLAHETFATVLQVLLFSVIGMVGSYWVAYYGIRVNTLANARTAFASLRGEAWPVVNIPLMSGMSIGLFLISLELVMMVVILLFVPKEIAGICFLGFAIGESLGASVLRIAGGIFTKIADIGSDLMKIVFNVKEDDPRNPGVIADCVGDNAGDSVGPTADGFETYGVTGVALISFITLAVTEKSVGADYEAIQGKLIVWLFAMRFLMDFMSGLSYFLNQAISKAKYAGKKEFDFEEPLSRLIWIASILCITTSFGMSWLLLADMKAAPPQPGTVEFMEVRQMFNSAFELEYQKADEATWKSFVTNHEKHWDELHSSIEKQSPTTDRRLLQLMYFGVRDHLPSLGNADSRNARLGAMRADLNEARGIFVNPDRPTIPLEGLWWQLAAIISCGTLAAVLIPEFTKVFTSSHSKHVNEIVTASREGGASLTILSGLVAGNFSAFWTGMLIAGLMGGAYFVSGLGMAELMGQHASVFAFGLVAFGFLCMGPVTIAVDSYGPVTDNAQSVFELAQTEHIPGISAEIERDFGFKPDFERGKHLLEANDSAGNTFKATAKPVLIGTAVVGATTMIFSIILMLEKEGLLHLSLTDAPVLLGFICGGSVIYWFCGASMQAVTTGAYRAVEYIKQNMDLTKKEADLEDSKTVVRICTEYAQSGMWNIFIALMAFTLAFALFDPNFFVAYLVSIAVFGLFQAIYMANAGGAWDNAKKLVEVDLREKGTPLHEATVIGDTVGDPFKDTTSVALNPIIKFSTLFGLLAVEIAVKIKQEAVAAASTDYTPYFGGALLLVAFVFVWRSFYKMRIPEKT